MSLRLTKPVFLSAVLALPAVGSATASPADNLLPENRQQHIWDIEHATFMLETYFGRALQQAWRTRDAQKLGDFLVPDARLSMFSEAAPMTRAHPPLVEHIRKAPAHPVEAVDASGWAESLVQWIEDFSVVKKTKLRVLALDTDDQRNWKATLLLEAYGKQAAGTPLLYSGLHEVALRFQNDAAVKEGRIIAAWREETGHVRRSSQLLFEEVSDKAGLGGLTLRDNWTREPALRSQYWFQLAVEDFNRDGYPDIAITTIYGEVFLLRSERGKRFVDVTAGLGLRGWKLDPRRIKTLCCWIDADNDGWMDLLLGDTLYRNREGLRFEDIAARSGLVIGDHAMGAAVADYDGDGLVDLYILYQHPREALPQQGPAPWVGDHDSGAPNELWRNMGDGHFRNVTAQSGAGGGRRKSFAAAWHHLDADAFPDLYIANDFGQNVHLRNRGDGTFEDVSSRTGTADFATSMGVCAGDLNNDGHPELYVANMFSKMGRRIIRHVGPSDYSSGVYEQILGSCAGNRLYTAGPAPGPHREISEAAGVNPVGWAYAPAMADFDSDGLLDLYATAGFMSFDRKKPDG